MPLTALELTRLIARLEEARRTFHCPAGRAGEPVFVEKPNSRRPVGYRYPNGDVLVLHEGRRGIWVKPGPHGKAFIGIDPATGEVSCSECQKKKGGD